MKNGFWSQRYLFPALIFFVALLQFANTFQHNYAWDDKLVISGNEYTQKGIAGIPAIFLNRVSVPFKSVYRPVPQSLFAVEYELFKNNPHAGHFFNGCWYAIACLLVYCFMRFVFPGYHPVFAACVTLLYTVHPLHTEVAANIKSRDEILAFLFGLAAIIYSVKGLEQRRWIYVGGALLLWVAAVLSKENALTLLPIVVVVYWFRSATSKVDRKIIYVTLSAGIAAILLYFFSQGGNKNTDQSALLLDSTVLNNIFLWTSESHKVLPTALVNIGRYFSLFLYPHPLVHLYGYNQVSLKGWWSWEALGMVLLLAGIMVYIWKNWRKKTPVFFGLVFFGVTYAIYSNIFILAPDTMADRYLFMPSLGLALIVVSLIFQAGKIDLNTPSFASWRPPFALLLFVLFTTVLFAKTWVTNRDWKDDTTLIKNRIRYMSENAAAQATYGYILNMESNAATTKTQHLELQKKAMQAYMKSIAIYPDFPWAWISVGKIFAENEQFDKAELAFLKAQQLEPLSPDGYYYLGTLYFTLNESKYAINYLEQAILLNPAMEEGFVMLGKAYLQDNNVDNLGALAESALRRFPQNVEFAALMAAYHMRKDHLNEASKLASEVLKIQPNNLIARSVITALQSE